MHSIRSQFISFITALLLILLLPLGAFAVTDEAGIPEEALRHFSADAFYEPFRVTGWVNPTLPWEPTDEDEPDSSPAAFSDWAFALLQYREITDIHAFRKTDAGWEWQYNGFWDWAGIYPGETAEGTIPPARLYDATEQLTAFSLLLGHEDAPDLTLYFMLDENEAWRMYFAETQNMYITTEKLGEIGFMPKDGGPTRTVRADFEGRLPYFQPDMLPLTPEEALGLYSFVVEDAE